MDNNELEFKGEQKKVHELNETATFLWESIEEPIAVSELADKLASEFEVSPIDALNDTAEIVLTWQNHGMIESLEAPS